MEKSKEFRLDINSLIPWQRECLNVIEHNDNTVIVAGRRSGKTHFIRFLAHLTALSNPGIKLAIVYPTYRQARSVLYDTLTEDYHSHPEFFRKMYKPVMFFEYFNKSTLQIYSLERKDTLRGLHLKMCIIDEAQELNSDGLRDIELIISPTLTPLKGKKPGKLVVFGTSKGKTTLYQLAKLQETREDWKTLIIPTTPKNCPHLDANFLIKKQREMGTIEYDREYLCSFQSYQGLIYSIFDKNVHLFDKLPEGTIQERIAGLDVGFTHPMSLVVCLKINDKWYLVDEFKKSNLTFTEDSGIKYIKNLIEKWKVEKLYIPPESGQVKKTLKPHLINTAIYPANNAVADGISHVRSLLHFNFDKKEPIFPKLYIHNSCTDIISEFGLYEYKKNQEIPEKINDDALDALRYALFSHHKKTKTTVVNDIRY